MKFVLPAPAAKAPAHVALVPAEDVRSPDAPTRGTGAADVGAEQSQPDALPGLQLPADVPTKFAETMAAIKSLIDLKHSSDDFDEQWETCGITTELIHFLEGPSDQRKPAYTMTADQFARMDQGGKLLIIDGQGGLTFCTPDCSEAARFATQEEDIKEAWLSWGEWCWNWCQLQMIQKNDLEMLQIVSTIKYLPTDLRCRLYAKLCLRYQIPPSHCLSEHALRTFGQKANACTAIRAIHGPDLMAQTCKIPFPPAPRTTKSTVARSSPGAHNREDQTTHFVFAGDSC